ncbi:Ankyrin repeat and SOCS box protein 2 [Ancistrocladus abbreviatus]
MAAIPSHSSYSLIESSIAEKPLKSAQSLSSQLSLPPPCRNQFLTPKVSLGTNRSLKWNTVSKFAVKASAVIADGNSKAQISDKKCENPIIVIDNYDSFTYNLCQYMGELGCDFEVYRNDELSVEELKRKNPRGILISPGPGTPQDSGISLQTVLELGPTVPLFGVCMGLQCIGEAFGGKIVRSPCGVMHGKSSLVHYDEKGYEGLLSGLSNPFTAGRYHSLVIEQDSFPDEVLEITAWTVDGLIMAARHREYKHLQGVQFHPESIITTEGKMIVRNFIRMIERREADRSKS